MNRKNRSRKLQDLTQRAAEALDAARMKCCGKTLKEIGERLDCSIPKAHALVQEGIRSYRESAREEIAAWVEDAVAELLQLKDELWIQWQRSKQDHTRHTIKKTADGPEETDLTEPQCGDPRIAAEIRGCIESIAKLLGVFKTGVQLTQQTSVQVQAEAVAEELEFKQQLASMFATFLPPSVVDAHLFPTSSRPAHHDSSAQPSNGHLWPR